MQHIKMNLSLGEGPIWHSARKSWCWVDINTFQLFELPFGCNSTKNLQSHLLPFAGSAMATFGKTSVLLATENSIGSYNLDTCIFESLKNIDIPSNMRTNDGGMDFDGNFWFSVMEKEPSGPNGGVYSIDSKLRVRNHLEKVGIPNTTLWDPFYERFYLSDSFKQKMYRVPKKNLSTKDIESEIFYDLSNTDFTPDGGALDIEGNIWVAIWGGAKLICIDPNGDLIREILLPALQPTSCCFGGIDRKHLFVTSAREGLSDSEINDYPLSGSIFIFEVDVPGIEIPGFVCEMS